ncbi:hypothetical protein IW261DRAFT_1560806 [Armillaria novae-zelandiae]|uniref:DUF6535 domain-containing protein n=1 Tax=Armillaria novae-zelandiae TaxID=153914 RepID=A0AA39PJQ2_9AGAR|nr:hypothetical protein IW261DRAFT_1560806 [Armillaria novae-zelandiae]
MFYEQKYTDDAIYEEAIPNTRWGTYEDVSRNHDTNTVERSICRRIARSIYGSFLRGRGDLCSPNVARFAARRRLLYYRNRSSFSVPSLTAPQSTLSLKLSIAFVPAITDVWVNGLWSTSLFLNLTTALVTVLVKQWLHHYVALLSGPSRKRRFTDQFRYIGFQKWHVQFIIGLLPVLMRLALAIFLVGCRVLCPLCQAPSRAICAGTTLVYTSYAVATIIHSSSISLPYTSL